MLVHLGFKMQSIEKCIEIGQRNTIPSLDLLKDVC